MVDALVVVVHGDAQGLLRLLLSYDVLEEERAKISDCNRQVLFLWVSTHPVKVFVNLLWRRRELPLLRRGHASPALHPGGGLSLGPGAAASRPPVLARVRVGQDHEEVRTFLALDEPISKESFLLSSSSSTTLSSSRLLKTSTLWTRRRA